MNIPLGQLAIAFLPAIAGIAICWIWSSNAGRASYAVGRMLVQLLLVGYLLTFIFKTENYLLVLGVLLLMIVVSAWIAIGSLRASGIHAYLDALISVAVGGISTLVLITQGVLRLDPWFAPEFMIPLAGMIFANSMNTVSLAGERLEAEVEHGESFIVARSVAFNAALIPNINSMIAVGLVSLPGMMTGQILAGVSPLIAVRYQIMVMCMIFGAASLSAAVYLKLTERRQSTIRESEANT